MKRNSILFFTVIVLLVTACSLDKSAKDGLAFINVKKNYPVKELFLNDIANVSYLHLSTVDDDYLYKGRINYITANTAVVVNRTDESILFFTRDGNTKSFFNRKGQGPEDYGIYPIIMYDEVSDEVFVAYNYSEIIQVYSSNGTYKRKLTLPQGTVLGKLIDFDAHSLFFMDMTLEYQRTLALGDGEILSAENYVLPFYRISKTTGEVLDYIELKGNGLLLGTMIDGMWRVPPREYVLKCPEGVLLPNHQNDTVFLYRGDKSLTPVFYQTPFATSLNPVEFISQYLDFGSYQFIQVTILRLDEFAFFPVKYYVRNKNTGEIIRSKFLLSDYQGKEFIMNPSRPNAEGRPFSDGFIYNDGYCFELDLYELKQAYRENKLSGKLKELVSTLNEDEDNNVFMIVEFK